VSSHEADTSAPEALAACPVCRAAVTRSDGAFICEGCTATYPIRLGAPVLVAPESELHGALNEDDREGVGAYLASETPARRSAMDALAEWLRPEDRLWSRASQLTIGKLIHDVPPTGVILNIGSARERVLRQAFAGREVVKVGFPSRGGIDLYGDALQLPVRSGSVDLLMSSSVMEHLSDPERAASEQFRVVKDGGRVYAEIPFIRGYHMIPADYQRYTLSGIQRLFERAGFETLEADVCSGPFTALALCVQDCRVRLPRWSRLPALVEAALRRLIHPIKYLDRIVEGRKWARICACNFYYAGRKPPGAGPS
jgi:SAM-dependent methyltransferase/uncharacterized protein YbaR (Trm112 family)